MPENDPLFDPEELRLVEEAGKKINTAINEFLDAIVDRLYEDGYFIQRPDSPIPEHKHLAKLIVRDCAKPKEDL